MDGVANDVGDVLGRAVSLFGHAGHGEALDTGLAAAAEASAEIGRGTGESAGHLASAHHDALGAAIAGLDHAAGADDALTRHVAQAGESLDAHLAEATELHAANDGVMDSLNDWSGLPVAEIAALKALRAQLAAMQTLMERQSTDAQHVADAIVGLEYGQ